MSDPFDDAVNGVQSAKADDSPVEVFYEKRKYPLCPEGLHKAICIRAEIKDANPNGQYYREGDKRLHLTFEPTDLKYEDDQKQERKYRVFYRPLPISFGERSNLRKLLLKITGVDISKRDTPLLKKTVKKIPLGGGRFKEGTAIVFDQKILENMTVVIDVEHQTWNSNNGDENTSASIVNVKAPDEMKKANYDLLPPEARVDPMSTEEIDLQSEERSAHEIQVDLNESHAKLEQEQKDKLAEVNEAFGTEEEIGESQKKNAPKKK